MFERRREDWFIFIPVVFLFIFLILTPFWGTSSISHSTDNTELHRYEDEANRRFKSLEKRRTGRINYWAYQLGLETGYLEGVEDVIEDTQKITPQMAIDIKSSVGDIKASLKHIAGVDCDIDASWFQPHLEIGFATKNIDYLIDVHLRGISYWAEAYYILSLALNAIRYRVQESKKPHKTDGETVNLNIERFNDQAEYLKLKLRLDKSKPPTKDQLDKIENEILDVIQN